MHSQITGEAFEDANSAHTTSTQTLMSAKEPFTKFGAKFTSIRSASSYSLSDYLTKPEQNGVKLFFQKLYIANSLGTPL